MKLSRFPVSPLVTTLALALTGHAAANTAPFTETFSDPGDGYDFDAWVSDGVGYTLNPSGGELVAAMSDGARTYATVGVDGVPLTTGTTVFVSTEFDINDSGTNATRVGLVLFAAGADIEPVTAPSYLVYISEPSAFDTPAFIARELNTNELYTGPDFTEATDFRPSRYLLEVAATLNDATIDFVATVTDLNDGTRTETDAFSLARVAGLGTNFGVHVDRNTSGPLTTISFDNYSVAVPEPASLALLALGGAMIATRRR